MLQIATVAVIALLAALPGGIKLPPDASTWGTVGITAVFATALAFLVQTWTQSLVPAVAAADHHDDGTCFCRHIRRVFREKSFDRPDYFRRGVRADGDVGGGNQIISEDHKAGKLSGSIY